MVFAEEDYEPFCGRDKETIRDEFLRVEFIYDALANTTHCFVVPNKEAIEKQLKNLKKSQERQR